MCMYLWCTCTCSLLPPSPSCSKSLPQQVLSQLEANVSVVVSLGHFGLVIIFLHFFVLFSLSLFFPLQSEPLFSCLMNCEEFLNLLTTSSGIGTNDREREGEGGRQRVGMKVTDIFIYRHDIKTLLLMVLPALLFNEIISKTRR